MSNKIVAKFGGSNLKSSSDYHRLTEIIRAYDRPPVVVVSAYFGLTNRILKVLQKSPFDRENIEKFIHWLYALKHNLVSENISLDKRQEAMDLLNERIDKFHKSLTSIHFIGEIPDFLYDQVLSFGERLNSLLISQMLNDRGFDCEEALPEKIG